MLRKLAVACGATAVVVGSLAPAVADAVPTVPSPPVGVVAYSSGSRSLTAYWQPSLFDGGSPIEYYEATVTPGGGTCAIEALTDAMSCGIDGLEPNNSYSVVVKVVNRAGLSAQSDPSDPVMLWGLPKITSVKPGSRKVRVKWSSAVDSSVTGFLVKALNGKRTCQAPTSKRSCVVRGLKNGTKYRFEVSVRSGLNVIVTSKPSKAVKPRRIKK